MTAMHTQLAAAAPARFTPPGVVAPPAPGVGRVDATPQFGPPRGPWPMAHGGPMGERRPGARSECWPPCRPVIHGGEQLKSKDFAHIAAFDGDLNRFGKQDGGEAQLSPSSTWREGASHSAAEQSITNERVTSSARARNYALLVLQYRREPSTCHAFKA
jgi:hypothetical protein